MCIYIYVLCVYIYIYNFTLTEHVGLYIYFYISVCNKNLRNRGSEFEREQTGDPIWISVFLIIHSVIIPQSLRVWFM